MRNHTEMEKLNIKVDIDKFELGMKNEVFEIDYRSGNSGTKRTAK